MDLPPHGTKRPREEDTATGQALQQPAIHDPRHHTEHEDAEPSPLPPRPTYFQTFSACLGGLWRQAWALCRWPRTRQPATSPRSPVAVVPVGGTKRRIVALEPSNPSPGAARSPTKKTQDGRLLYKEMIHRKVQSGRPLRSPPHLLIAYDGDSPARFQNIAYDRVDTGIVRHRNSNEDPRGLVTRPHITLNKESAGVTSSATPEHTRVRNAYEFSPAMGILVEQQRQAKAVRHVQPQAKGRTLDELASRPTLPRGAYKAGVGKSTRQYWPSLDREFFDGFKTLQPRPLSRNYSKEARNGLRRRRARAEVASAAAPAATNPTSTTCAPPFEHINKGISSTTTHAVANAPDQDIYKHFRDHQSSDVTHNVDMNGDYDVRQSPHEGTKLPMPNEQNSNQIKPATAESINTKEMGPKTSMAAYDAVSQAISGLSQEARQIEDKPHPPKSSPQLRHSQGHSPLNGHYNQNRRGAREARARGESRPVVAGNGATIDRMKQVQVTRTLDAMWERETNEEVAANPESASCVPSTFKIKRESVRKNARTRASGAVDTADANAKHLDNDIKLEKNAVSRAAVDKSTSSTANKPAPAPRIQVDEAIDNSIVMEDAPPPKKSVHWPQPSIWTGELHITAPKTFHSGYAINENPEKLAVPREPNPQVDVDENSILEAKTPADIVQRRNESPYQFGKEQEKSPSYKGSDDNIAVLTKILAGLRADTPVKAKPQTSEYLDHYLQEKQQALYAKQQLEKQQQAEFERKIREAEEEAKRKKEEQRRQAEARAKAREAAKAAAKLIISLSATCNQQIEAVMAEDNILKEVTPGPGTRLTRRDLGTVLPQANQRADDASGWLNDEVINCFLTRVCEMAHLKANYNPKDKPALYFNQPTQFITKLAKSGPQSVARWGRRNKVTGKDLLAVRKFFIPCNLTNNHWTLLVVSPAERKLEYYDSLGGSGKNVFAAIRPWLAFHLGTDYIEGEWQEITDNSARQDNGSDCGVFACYNALAEARDVPPATAVVASKMPLARMHMVGVLINGGFGDDGEFGW